MAIPIPVIAGIFEIGSRIIERLLPDPAEAARAQLELAKLQESGELERLAKETLLLQGQIDTNKVEAASENIFKSGWRPAIGWTCAISLFTYYVPYCIVATVLWAMQVHETGFLMPRPDLGIGDLMGLVLGMLGLAGMRTFERAKGIIPPQQ